MLTAVRDILLLRWVPSRRSLVAFWWIALLYCAASLATNAIDCLTCESQSWDQYEQLGIYVVYFAMYLGFFYVVLKLADRVFRGSGDSPTA